MTKLKKSKEGNLYFADRGIPKGCQLCLKGAKMVLFINGLCQKPLHCYWYCPFSEERRDKTFSYADEIEINSKEDLMNEIKTIRAEGMSITGGDPLLESNLEKTLDYIKFAKNEMGKGFHIHLYTNGLNFSEDIAKRLADAGLDEIRFHPSKEHWSSVEKALGKGICVGAEVPVIPDGKSMKNLEEFILFLDKIGAEFVNLNEFEICAPNGPALRERGFFLKEGTIASVEHSKEKASNLIHKLETRVSLKIHFCSARAKDYFQVKNRYLRRAESIKLPFEEITEEGLFLFAQVEGEENQLNSFHDFLTSKFHIAKELCYLDNKSIKLPVSLASKKEVLSYMDKYNLEAIVVESLPFRGRYEQITETTPIKIYMEELGNNED